MVIKKRKTNTHNELNQFNGVKFPGHKCTKQHRRKYTYSPTYIKSPVSGRIGMKIFKNGKQKKLIKNGTAKLDFI